MHGGGGGGERDLRGLEFTHFPFDTLEEPFTEHASSFSGAAYITALFVNFETPHMTSLVLDPAATHFVWPISVCKAANTSVDMMSGEDRPTCNIVFFYYYYVVFVVILFHLLYFVLMAFFFCHLPSS